MKRQPPTPAITVSIPGRLRYWVAEALFTAVRQHAEVEQQRTPRARRQLRPPVSIADGLRDLAAEISDPAVNVFELEG